MAHAKDGDQKTFWAHYLEVHRSACLHSAGMAGVRVVAYKMGIRRHRRAHLAVLCRAGLAEYHLAQSCSQPCGPTHKQVASEVPFRTCAQLVLPQGRPDRDQEAWPGWRGATGPSGSASRGRYRRLLVWYTNRQMVLGTSLHWITHN
eukprot:scaffold7842_cov444-Prasinococcus_capsulatus_cf.AAC.1